MARETSRAQPSGNHDRGPRARASSMCRRGTERAMHAIPNMPSIGGHMRTGQRFTSGRSAPDLRRAYRTELVVEHIVELVEALVRERHGGAYEPAVSIWHDDAAPRWTASVAGPDGAALATADGETEIEAARGLLHVLRSHDGAL
jgi:hypothetical protein